MHLILIVVSLKECIFDRIKTVFCVRYFNFLIMEGKFSQDLIFIFDLSHVSLVWNRGECD